MYLLRNVHDPIPCRMSRARIKAHADRVRESLGIEPATGVARAFARLGGKYERVFDTFGRYTDKVVIRSAEDLTHEDRHRPELATLGIAECLGHLFLHHPLVMREHGPDAVTAVRRFHTEGDGLVANREAQWFGIEIAMPAEAFRAAHAADPSHAALAAAFGVHHDTAGARARSLGLDPRPVDDGPDDGLAPAPAAV